MSAVRSFATWLRRLIDRVETQPWGPAVLVPVVAGVIAVRNLVEIAVGGNPVFEGMAAFVHYPLAYVAPFVALTLVLALWAGVAPMRVARLMMLAWLLTLVPPLADLILHRAHAPTIGYLNADPVDLPRVWLRFFDPTVDLVGTTMGIRVETLLAVLLGGLYAGIVSRRVWRGVGAAATVYVTSLFFFSLPVLITALFRAFRPALSMPELFHGVGILYRTSSAAAPDSAGSCGSSRSCSCSAKSGSGPSGARPGRGPAVRRWRARPIRPCRAARSSSRPRRSPARTRPCGSTSPPARRCSSRRIVGQISR